MQLTINSRADEREVGSKRSDLNDGIGFPRTSEVPGHCIRSARTMSSSKGEPARNTLVRPLKSNPTGLCGSDSAVKMYGWALDPNATADTKTYNRLPIRCPDLIPR